MSSVTGRFEPWPNFPAVCHPVISDETAERPSRWMATKRASGNSSYRYSPRRQFLGNLSR
jgi:hypothetical protein